MAAYVEIAQARVASLPCASLVFGSSGIARGGRRYNPPPLGIEISRSARLL